MTCRLCEIIYSYRSYYDIADTEPVNIKVGVGGGSGKPQFELECGRGPDRRDVLIPFPKFGQDGHRAQHFRRWVDDCNRSHKCRHQNSRLPRRTLDLSDPDRIRLVEHPQDAVGDYIALSHRWRTNQEHNFCTYLCNLVERQEGFAFSALPKRFQDAVKVTRQLDIRFLWIDSLCIVQAHGETTNRCPRGCSEGGGDWNIECQKMEDYYGSAYCVIAATCATNCNEDESFLEISKNGLWHNHCRTDFDGDVTDSELNKRGWVFQERALARRTIHFASNQAYWECGHKGSFVRSETFCQFSNAETRLLSDSNFPDIAKKQFDNNQLALLQWLLRKYSQCEVTFPTDRAVAFSGLEKRLETALKTKCQYGVFDRYLHRCIFWQPTRHTQRINAPASKVPSWSWMAYSGEISWPAITFNYVAWNRDVRILGQDDQGNARSTLTAPARSLKLSDLALSQARSGDRAGLLSTLRSWHEKLRSVTFDSSLQRSLTPEPTQNYDPQASWEALLQELRCCLGIGFVVLGIHQVGFRTEEPEFCYVLVIGDSVLGLDGKYERIGAGVMKCADLAETFSSVEIV